jgi:hypothetical protein
VRTRFSAQFAKGLRLAYDAVACAGRLLPLHGVGRVAAWIATGYGPAFRTQHSPVRIARQARVGVSAGHTASPTNSICKWCPNAPAAADSRIGAHKARASGRDTDVVLLFVRSKTRTKTPNICEDHRCENDN